MLQPERKRASFHKRDLSLLIHGGQHGLQTFLKQQAVVDNDPQLRFDPTFLHQSREQMMAVMARKLLKIHSYHDLFPLDGSTEVLKGVLLTYQAPLSLHAQMFLTTLDNLCDEEQRERFYEPARRGEILGCYAQTELGHGSDIQRLETTATFDKNSQQFVINSPTTSSAKWWVGELGVYCTHSALFAQLIIDGKSYGLHPFMVQIRDPKTMQPLPGVEVGDVGPKQGFNTKDNGYCLFNNIRIPRKNMFMKYHVVSKEGKYSVQGDQRISYATMLMTRSAIAQLIPFTYAKIVTIITKYSILRRQFKNSKGDEIPVLDYQTQQAKVISRIAETYAYIATSKSIVELANFVYSEAKNGRFDRLNEAHILSSSAKAYLTCEALNNSEVARRAAGGHGFSAYNGIVGMMHDISPTVTLEGQYTVLMLQVARFLFKSVKNLQKGKKLEPSVQYLSELAKGNKLSMEVDQDSLSCPVFVSSLIRNYACSSVKIMAQKLNQGIKEGLSQKQAWDSYAGISLTEAAIAHSVLIIFGYYLTMIETIQEPKLKAVMTKLALLFGLEKLIERASKVYEAGIIQSAAFGLIRKKRQALLGELRPEALTLVQAFEYSDNTLQSAIAHSNEKPYENLIDWARRYNTVNRPEERDQINASIKKAVKQLRPKL